MARLTCDVKTAYGDVKYVSFTYSSFYHSLTVFIRFLVPMKFKQHCANDCLSAMQLTAMLVFLIHVLKLFPSLNKQDSLGLFFLLFMVFLLMFFCLVYCNSCTRFLFSFFSCFAYLFFDMHNLSDDRSSIYCYNSCTNNIYTILVQGRSDPNRNQKTLGSLNNLKDRKTNSW